MPAWPPTARRQRQGRAGCTSDSGGRGSNPCRRNHGRSITSSAVAGLQHQDQCSSDRGRCGSHGDAATRCASVRLGRAALARGAAAVFLEVALERLGALIDQRLQRGGGLGRQEIGDPHEGAAARARRCPAASRRGERSALRRRARRRRRGDAPRRRRGCARARPCRWRSGRCARRRRSRRRRAPGANRRVRLVDAPQRRPGRLDADVDHDLRADGCHRVTSLRSCPRRSAAGGRTSAGRRRAGRAPRGRRSVRRAASRSSAGR